MTTGRINQVSVHNHFLHPKMGVESNGPLSKDPKTPFSLVLFLVPKIENLWIFKCLSLFPPYTLLLSSVGR